MSTERTDGWMTELIYKLIIRSGRSNLLQVLLEFAGGGRGALVLGADQLRHHLGHGLPRFET